MSDDEPKVVKSGPLGPWQLSGSAKGRLLAEAQKAQEKRDEQFENLLSVVERLAEVIQRQQRAIVLLQRNVERLLPDSQSLYTGLDDTGAKGEAED